MDTTTEIVWATYDPRTDAIRVDVATSVIIDGNPIARVEDMAPLLSDAERADIATRCRNVCGEIATLLTAAKARTVGVATVPVPAS